MTKNGNGNGGNANTSNTKKVIFNLHKSVQVTKIFAREDHRLTKNDPIFTMIDTHHPDGKREPFLSTVLGTVTKLYIHEWDILSYGSIILEYEECLHTITFKNLCCDCGADLNQLSDKMETIVSRNRVADRLADTTATSSPTTVSTEHAIPDLRLTLEIAEKFGIEERDRLLRERKLDLLVDLDQTLLHTTNSSHYYPYSPDIFAYPLSTQSSQTFYTKLRPGVKEFLTNLLPYYQFHIVTFGERLYAHTMARLIDPDRRFFYNRILSRNECFDPTRKTANLGSLFPCGDSMVCIIDDREDVWNYAKNLVHVKPYVWFKDVGDINDIHLPSPPIPSEQLIPPISEKEFEEQLENSEHMADERIEMDSRALVERTTEEGYQNAIQRGEKRKLDHDNSAGYNKEKEETSKKLKEQNNDDNEQISTPTVPEMKDLNITIDTDNYLLQLEVILKRIHDEFYTMYDKWTQDKTRVMPDLKQILPDIRRRVLMQVSVCFSHLMPQGYPLEKHRATILARAMGANVTSDLDIDDEGNCLTTHVIAGKRTSKVDRAMKYKIRVVTPEWLIDCYEQWERKPEENYALTADYDVKKSRLFTRETPRIAFNDSNVGTERMPLNRQKSQSSADDEPTSTSVTEKSDKPSLKRPRTPEPSPETNPPAEETEDGDEIPTRQFNFSMSVDELSDMEKEVNDFCNEDDGGVDDNDDDEEEDDDDGNENDTEGDADKDDSNDTGHRPSKKKRTSLPAPTTTTTNPVADDGNNYDSDSSSSQKLHDLILGKKRESDSEEENLDDDEAPHGWNDNQKRKHQQS